MANKLIQLKDGNDNVYTTSNQFALCDYGNYYTEGQEINLSTSLDNVINGIYVRGGSSDTAVVSGIFGMFIPKAMLNVGDQFLLMGGYHNTTLMTQFKIVSNTQIKIEKHVGIGVGIRHIIAV